MAAQYLMQQPSEENKNSEMVTEAVLPSFQLLEDLRDTVFKLRAFTESADGDVSFGVELGMQRAADMIEHIITRYETGI